MGRPERPVDPSAGPIAAFAVALRELRARAGNPTYRDLAKRARFSPSVLSAATSGFQLPSLRVALALAEACGGDRDEWTRRWRQAAGQRCPDRPRDRTSGPPLARERDDEHVRRTGEAQRPIPAQLPVGPRHFAGRAAELARLSAALLGSGTGAPLLINGPVGIGKSALAIRWGHQHSAHFRDGLLYVDLAAHGHDDVLNYLLQALGCAPSQLNASEPKRIALYRSLLATLRVLVLLDNATDEASLRPLLARSVGSAIVVTSRNRLAGLDEVDRLTLDVLPLDQSLMLISSIVGAERIVAEYDEACSLAELCDHLPLALWMAAVRIALRPGWTLGHAVTRMRDESRRLTQFDHGETGLGERLRGAFASLHTLPAWAWRAVSAAEGRYARVDRLADQLRLPRYGAEDLLEALVDAGLLIGTAKPGCYRVPHLFRLFARASAEHRPIPPLRIVRSSDAMTLPTGRV